MMSPHHPKDSSPAEASSRLLLLGVATGLGLLGLVYVLKGHALLTAIYNGQAAPWLEALRPDYTKMELASFLKQSDLLMAVAGAAAFIAAWFAVSWQQLSGRTRGLTATLVVITLLQIPLSWTSPVGWHDTVLHRTKQFLMRDEHGDSWNPMFKAYAYTKQAHRRPLYDEIFFERKTKFQYAPTSLLFVPILKWLSPNHTWPDRPRGPARFISWCFVLLSAASTALILRFAWTQHGWIMSQRRWPDSLAQDIAALGLTLTFYPVLRSFAQGQIQTWINGLVAAALLSWLTNRITLAGALTGLVCLMKPTYGLVLAWAVIRRQGRFVIAASTVVLAGLALSVRLFGWADHLNYMPVLSYMAKHGECFYPNQSFNGLLNRLFFNGPNFPFDPRAYPPFHLWVYIGTPAGTAILVGLLLAYPMLKRLRPTAVEFAAAVLTATIVSPIAWEHHYGILLPIYALLLGLALGKPVMGKATLPCLGVSYLLTSNYLFIAQKTAAIPWLNLLQSYLFFGALAALALLYAYLPVVSDGGRRVDTTNQKPDPA